VLYTHCRNREAEHLKMLARMHGAKIQEPAKPFQIDDYDGDPDSLSHLSAEERQQRTEALMEKHMRIFKDGRIG
jgi:hypothetical protein